MKIIINDKFYVTSDKKQFIVYEKQEAKTKKFDGIEEQDDDSEDKKANDGYRIAGYFPSLEGVYRYLRTRTIMDSETEGTFRQVVDSVTEDIKQIRKMMGLEV